MSLVRFWLPVAVCVPGLILFLVGLARTDYTMAEGGGLLLSAGLSIWLLNFLYRVSVSGDRDRDAEDEARAHFDRHGRWPDEDDARRRP